MRKIAKVHLKSSIYFKNTLGFLILMIAIYILSVYIFQITNRTMIIQADASIKKQLTIYLNNLESELIRTNLMQTDLTVDSDLNDLKFVTQQEITPDDIKKINNVIDKLTYIKNNSNNVLSTSAYMVNLGMKLNSTGGNSSYENIERNLLVKKFEKNKLNKGISLIDSELYIQSTPFYWNGKIKDLPFVLETHLSKINILKNINQYNISPDAKSYFIFEDEKIILSSDIKDHFPTITNLLKRLDSITKEDIHREKLWGEKYIVVNYYSDFFNARYIQLIPEKVLLANVNKFSRIFIFFSILVFLAVIIYTTYIYFLLKSPMDILIGSFSEVEKGNFDLQIKRKQQDEFSLVYNSFNTMVFKIKTLINEVYVQKILNQKSELRQLQSQINPHFLYNSFFILRNRISRKSFDSAEQFCDMLGQYFQYITQNYKDFSTLKDEIQHAKLYADIQAVRFSSRINIQFQQLPEKYHDIIVPKLIMQPILENAFKYGLENKEFDGKLIVSYEELDQYLYINVDDNGDSFSSQPQNIEKMQEIFNNHQEIKEPSGLMNIHKRIQLFSDKRSGIFLSKSKIGGLRVTLKFYLQGGTSHDHDTNS